MASFHFITKIIFYEFQLRQSTLKDLRTWLSEQNHLRGCCRDDSPLRLDKPGVDSDNFLLRFLRVKKFNVRKASKMMDKYLAMRCDNPHWFMDLDPSTNEHMQELVRLVLMKRNSIFFDEMFDIKINEIRFDVESFFERILKFKSYFMFLNVRIFARIVEILFSKKLFYVFYTKIREVRFNYKSYFCKNRRDSLN
jgi:hypothetical protein